MSFKTIGWFSGLSSLVVLATACAVESAQTQDEVGTMTEEVLNGNGVAQSDTLQAVAVYHGGIRPCSGVVIDRVRGWVLTAAHCVTVDPDHVTTPVKDGPFSISQSVTPGLKPPSDAIPIPKADVHTHGAYDLALLHVSGLAGITRQGIWLGDPSVLVGQSLTFYGYGRNRQTISPDTEDGTTGAGRLRQAILSVSGSAADGETYTMPVNLGSQICGHGDSGGPSYWLKTFSGGESARLVTGAHSFGNNDSPTWCNDASLSVGAAWLTQTVGGVYIYRVRPGTDGRQYLDVRNGSASSGAAVQTWSQNGGAAQLWTYDASTKAIRNWNGKCLDVTGGSSSWGTLVQTYECNGSAAQQWEFTGDLAIRSALGVCLDVPNGTRDLGVQLHTWECNGSSAQRWVVSPSF